MAQLRIKLNMITYDPVGSKTQVFPTKKTKAKDETALRNEEKERFLHYENSVDFKTKIMGVTKFKAQTVLKIGSSYINIGSSSVQN
jgi:hypothetical protein